MIKKDTYTKSGDEVLRNIPGGPGFQDRLKVPGVLQVLERKPRSGGEEHLDDLVIVLPRGSGLLKLILSWDLMAGARYGAGSRGTLSNSLLGLRGEDVVCVPILIEKNSPWVQFPDLHLRNDGLRTRTVKEIIDLL